MHTKLLQSCPTHPDPWTVAHQAPLSTGFSRQEYYSGFPFPSLIYSNLPKSFVHKEKPGLLRNFSNNALLLLSPCHIQLSNQAFFS